MALVQGICRFLPFFNRPGLILRLQVFESAQEQPRPMNTSVDAPHLPADWAEQRALLGFRYIFGANKRGAENCGAWARVSLLRSGCSRQFGRASAPTMPHRVHTMHRLKEQRARFLTETMRALAFTLLLRRSARSARQSCVTSQELWAASRRVPSPSPALSPE